MTTESFGFGTENIDCTTRAWRATWCAAWNTITNNL